MWELLQQLVKNCLPNKIVVPTSPIPVEVPTVPSFDGTELKLVRSTFTKFSTQGELFINGVHECWTIELPKEPFLDSHICIPCGTFEIELFDSPKHGPNTPQLKDVPGRTYIQIHSANWAINPDPTDKKRIYLEGCIAPGTEKDENVVYNSKVALKAIMAKIDWTKKVKITITE